MSTTLDTESLYQRGFQFRCEGRYSEARQDLIRVLEMNPGHAKALHQLALIQGFEGDFEGSLDALATLTAQHPSNLELRYDLAMTQMMLGYSEEACAQFRHILTIDPAHEKARQQLVYC